MRSTQMEKDRRSDHSDVYTEGSAFDPGAPFPIKDDRPLSYFNDPEARAWERKLFAPDPGLDLTDRKEQKEARDLLWKADISTAMPPLKISDWQNSMGTAGGSAAEPDTPSGQNSAAPSSSSGSRKSTSRPTTRNTGSSATSRNSSLNRAWEILSGNGSADYLPYGYDVDGNRTSNYEASNYRSSGYRTASPKKAGYKTTAQKTASPKAAGKKNAALTGSTRNARSGFIAKSRRAEAASRAKIKREARRKSNSVPVFALMITVILTLLTIMATFFFINRVSGDPDTGGSAGQDIFIGIDDGKDDGGGEDSGGNAVLTEFGYDYSDFYSSKYIASYEDPGDGGKYQELCAINPEAFFGTPSRPASSSKKLYYSDVQPTWITLGYVNTDSYLNCGYTIMYADPEDSSSYGLPDNMYPPGLADPGKFFEAVVRCFTEPESYYQDNYNNYRIGKIQNATIGEHNILYMELTYKDSVGREVLDVYSFEQKPKGIAFIAECRSEKGDVKNGEEALSNLYEMLTFQTDSFGLIDASRFQFTQARVYNSGNSHSATIDVSDLGDLKYSRIYFKDLVNFHIGEYGSLGDPELQITMDYIAYSSVDDLGGYEKWIDYTLETENERGDYVEPARETDRGQFTYEGNTVYYLSMAGSEKLSSSTEDVALYMYRIETQDSEVTLDLRFEHNVPESWDPEGFLKDHVIIENVR